MTQNIEIKGPFSKFVATGNVDPCKRYTSHIENKRGVRNIEESNTNKNNIINKALFLRT